MWKVWKICGFTQFSRHIGGTSAMLDFLLFTENQALHNGSVSVIKSARLSACMEQAGSHCTDFYEILFFSIFGETCEKVKVSLKSDRNNRHFM